MSEPREGAEFIRAYLGKNPLIFGHYNFNIKEASRANKRLICAHLGLTMCPSHLVLPPPPPGLSISRYGFLTVIKLFTLVIKRGINTINSGIYHFAFLIKGTFYTTSIPLLYHCIYPPCPPIRTVDTGGHGWTRVDTGGHGWTQVDTGGHSTNDRMHQATSCEARVLLVGGFRSNS